MIQTVAQRQAIEREIAGKVVDLLLAQGFGLEIDNGEPEGDECELHFTRESALEAMFATDEERVYCHVEDKERPVAWVYFVYGNSGWDVISDHTVNLEDVLKPAFELADKLEAQAHAP